MTPDPTIMLTWLLACASAVLAFWIIWRMVYSFRDAIIPLLQLVGALCAGFAAFQFVLSLYPWIKELNPS